MEIELKHAIIVMHPTRKDFKFYPLSFYDYYELRIYSFREKRGELYYVPVSISETTDDVTDIIYPRRRYGSNFPFRDTLLVRSKHQVVRFSESLDRIFVAELRLAWLSSIFDKVLPTQRSDVMRAMDLCKYIMSTGCGDFDKWLYKIA